MARMKPGTLFKTMPSVHMTKETTEAALRKAVQLTGAGSTTPARVKSQNVSRAAS
jgi:hypothetical protein